MWGALTGRLTSAAIAGLSSASTPSPKPANTHSRDRRQRFIVWLFPARAFRRFLSSSLQSCRFAALKKWNHRYPRRICRFVPSKPDQTVAQLIPFIANNSQLQQSSEELLANG